MAVFSPAIASPDRDRSPYREEPRRYTDGIPDFLKYPPQIDESTVGDQRRLIDEQKLDRLLALSRDRSCLEALEQTYGGDSDVVSYVTRPPAFLEVVALRPTDVVLEIGSGLGQFTTAIAKRVARVHALEVVGQQARFTRRRCAEAGVTNVEVACGGDDCRLPYRDCLFDVVVMNLVFEWCAGRVDEPHPAGQQRYLRDVLRVLKPGGTLFLLTKNRYSLHYLLGRGDEHAYRLPFGNALPRRLLAAVLKLTGRARTSGYLYSPPELRRITEDNGFTDVSMYCAIPDPRHPERIVPADARSLAEVRRQAGLPFANGRLTQPLMRLMPAAVAKYLTYGQVVLAHKPRSAA